MRRMLDHDSRFGQGPDDEQPDDEQITSDLKVVPGKTGSRPRQNQLGSYLVYRELAFLFINQVESE